jgi:hypothetical protein
MGVVEGAARRVLWLVVAILVALGGAGIVAAMDHVPGTGARAELTYPGDAAAEPALDAATTHLQTLSDEVDALGTIGRQALAAVIAGDVSQVNDLVAQGTTQVGVVKAEAQTLSTSLDAVPGMGGTDTELRVAPAVRERYARLATTRNLTNGLEADWATFTGRAIDAVNLKDLLARHDQETAAAARQGALAKYQTAVDLLDVSDATMARARGVRDRLAATTDVSTLTTWIDRNSTYDAALRELYTALDAAKGTVTSRVRKAYDAEQAARAQLPGDTRGLVVIMADVAQGGLNQAVISIEKARGALSDALDELQQLQTGASPAAGD